VPVDLRKAFFAALGATAIMGGPRTGGVLGATPRALASLRGALWGFLAVALSSEEKSRLGVALYDASTEYRDSPRYAWEDAWLERWLPAVGARESESRRSGGGESRRSGGGEDETSHGMSREGEVRRSRVLVGAAGAGREVMALLERGHDVVAIEPSPQMAALCRARTGGRVRVIEARYEELVGESDGERDHARDGVEREGTEQGGEGGGAWRTSGRDAEAGDSRQREGTERGGEGGGALRRGGRGAEARGAGQPHEAELRGFDAVVLGLGSLSHVLDARGRVVLAGALARMCPAGHILASAVAAPRARGVSRPGRAARMGRALARPIRTARHLPAVDPGEVVFGGLGFVKLFTRAELIELGHAMGRRTCFDDGAPDGMELCAFVID